MKFWWSGEVDGEVGDSYREACNEIEPAINGIIGPKHYGTQLLEWAFIGIILRPAFATDFPFKEIKKWHRKELCAEFRLKIDYSKFRESNGLGKRHLICLALLRSLRLMSDLHIDKSSIDALSKDFYELAVGNGWLTAGDVEYKT